MKDELANKIKEKVSDLKRGATEILQLIAKGLVLVICLVFFGSFLSSIFDGFFQGLTNQITVYALLCSKSANFYDCEKLGGETFLVKNSFHVNFEKQYVVYYNGLWVSRYDECEVFNAGNWSCQTSNSNEPKMSMRDGILSKLVHSSEEGRGVVNSYQQISYIEYLIRKAHQIF